MKAKQKITTALLMIALFLSTITCKKEVPDDPSIIKPGTEDGNTAKAVLGRGYDICDRFADTESLKEAVLDFNKLANSDKIIKDQNIASSEVNTKEGETIQGYQASFNYARTATAGIEGLFSAETGVNFGYERSRMTGYSYATVSSFTYKYGLYIDGRRSPESLSDYASEQFLSDAQSLETEDFIDIYGTHVVVAGKWGAAFDYSMSAKRKSISNEYSFGAFVKADATVSGINLGGSQEINAEFSNYYESSSKEVYAKAKGGDSEYVLAITAASTGEGLDAAYMAWIETIDKNPVFCDYYNEGLVPLYEFITDEEIRDKVQTGIENYMKEHNIETAEPVDAVISDDFHVANFCTAVSGDSEVDADGGGNIYVELSFTVQENFGSNNLELKIDMKVHEMKGDYTKIEGTTHATIVNNTPINSIELSNTSYTFSIEAPFNTNDYFTPSPWLTNNPPPSWLSDIYIRIDGSGGDDHEVIGVKGSVDIPVTVYEFGE